MNNSPGGGVAGGGSAPGPRNNAWGTAGPNMSVAPMGGGGAGLGMNAAQLMQHPLIQHLVTNKGGQGTPMGAHNAMASGAPMGAPNQSQPTNVSPNMGMVAGPQGSGGKFGPGGANQMQMLQHLLQMFFGQGGQMNRGQY